MPVVCLYIYSPLSEPQPPNRVCRLHLNPSLTTQSPQVQDSVPQDCPPSDASPKPQVVTRSSDGPTRNSGVPTNLALYNLLSSSSQNSGKRLPSIHWFVCQGQESGTAKRKGRIGLFLTDGWTWGGTELAASRPRPPSRCVCHPRSSLNTVIRVL